MPSVWKIMITVPPAISKNAVLLVNKTENPITELPINVNVSYIMCEDKKWTKINYNCTFSSTLLVKTVSPSENDIPSQQPTQHTKMKWKKWKNSKWTKNMKSKWSQALKNFSRLKLHKYQTQSESSKGKETSKNFNMPSLCDTWQLSNFKSDTVWLQVQYNWIISYLESTIS